MKKIFFEQRSNIVPDNISIYIEKITIMRFSNAGCILERFVVGIPFYINRNVNRKKTSLLL